METFYKGPIPGTCRQAILDIRPVVFACVCFKMPTYIKIKMIVIIFFASPVTKVWIEPSVRGEIFGAEEPKVPLLTRYLYFQNKIWAGAQHFLPDCMCSQRRQISLHIHRGCCSPDARMPRLIWVFAGCTCNFVENVCATGQTVNMNVLNSIMVSI